MKITGDSPSAIPVFAILPGVWTEQAKCQIAREKERVCYCRKRFASVKIGTLVMKRGGSTSARHDPYMRANNTQMRGAHLLGSVHRPIIGLGPPTYHFNALFKGFRVP